MLYQNLAKLLVTTLACLGLCALIFLGWLTYDGINAPYGGDDKIITHAGDTLTIIHYSGFSTYMVYDKYGSEFAIKERQIKGKCQQ